jgi:RNA polymerase sigma-70 factor, ECF subfamily
MDDGRPNGSDDLSLHAREAESLALRLLGLLERLSPAERTVFLLHDVFGRGHPEIAGIVHENERACEQLLVRARDGLRSAKRSIEASRRQRDDVAARFFACIGHGDIASATESLAPDAVAYTCGDTEPATPPAPILGRHAVAGSVDALSRTLRKAGVSVQLERLGGQPRASLRNREQRLVGTVSLEISEGLVQTIRLGSTERR